MLFKDLLVYKRSRLYKIAKHRKDDLKNQPHDYTGNNGLLPNQLSRHIQRNQTMREFIFLLNDYIVNILKMVKHLKSYTNFTIEKDDTRVR